MLEQLLLFGTSVYIGTSFFGNRPNITDTLHHRVQFEYDMGPLILGPVVQINSHNVSYVTDQVDSDCTVCFPGDFTTLGLGVLGSTRVGDGAIQFQPTIDIIINKIYSPIDRTYYNEEIVPLFPASSTLIFDDFIFSSHVGLDIRHPLWNAGPGVVANVNAGFQNNIGFDYGCRIGLYYEFSQKYTIVD